MVKNYDFCFPKAQDDLLKCLVLTTTQRYKLYCQRTVTRIENSHI